MISHRPVDTECQSWELGIVYNDELVTDPITSWKDLWRDDLKGKVALSTFPSFEDDAFVDITAQAWGLDLKTQEGEVFDENLQNWALSRYSTVTLMNCSLK